MKRIINKAAVVLSIVLVLSGLYGCDKGSENVSADRTVEATDEGRLQVLLREWTAPVLITR